MRFRCKVCGKEVPTSQATMRANSEGKPIPVCPRCIRKGDAATRNLVKIRAKRRAVGYVIGMIADIEADICRFEDCASYLLPEIAKIPELAKANRMGTLNAVSSVAVWMDSGLRKQETALKDSMLLSIACCWVDTRDFQEPLGQVLGTQAEDLRERLALKKETNPAKRSAAKRKRRKWEGTKKRREKERERKQNNKTTKEIQIGRSLAGVDEETVDAIYGDEKH